LGGKRWQALHRLIYVSAIAGVIHYLWLVKKDTRKPLMYGAILAVLLGYRIVVWVVPIIKKRRSSPATLPQENLETLKP
jgi:sulfoxide reductase heme-binding subunit YedZ